MKRRVVVTGIGCVTPVATGVEETWSRILDGISGIGPVTHFDPEGLKTQILGEVNDFNPEDFIDKKKVKRLDRFIHFALASAKMAWDQAGFGEPFDDEQAFKAGSIMGVGLGGIATLTENYEIVMNKGPARVSPFFIPRLIGNMAPGAIAMEYNLRGPNLCVSTACAAGAHGIGESMRAIQYGGMDVMLAGGAESVSTRTTMAGFNAARALSTRNDEPEKASRPFEKDRDGFVMSEGGGVMVLEELEHAKARGANILAELVGYGLTCDAYHMTAPDPEGRGTTQCMALALKDAGLAPEDIQYINAHGTSTGLNDAAETVAIRRVFGTHADKLAVSSTKSMHGHMLGATGAVEAVLTVLTLRDQVMPPTINYETPDPECDLDYVPNHKREGQIQSAVTNSFGFGGTNASLVIKVYQD